MNVFKYIVLICFAFYSMKSFAQAGYIIRFDGDKIQLNTLIERQGDFTLQDHIPFTNIYLLNEKPNRRIGKDKISDISSKIEFVSVNKAVEMRSKTPDDPFYKEQWQYDLIHAPEAWEYGTGGVTCRGDTIVLAVLDSGFDQKHEDIAPNVWVNHGEIPGDGKDNDGNGYIDDVFGLNTATDNDKHYLDSHGLKVSGILGAKGNNNKGVCGVNWDSKIMLVSNIQNDFYVIKGLHYVLMQRRKYNQSNGKEGAFVVSVNNSFGISNEFPSDGHEMWCSMYDSLGMAGILSAGATTNSNQDVDATGDIPSTCPSEYLMVVTNIDMNDKKVTNAGHGSKSVDIGAPGEGTFNVGLSNGYTTFSGTSAATPHVASAVGLLYSTACCNIIDEAKSNPSAACLKIKSYIYKGAIPNKTLNGLTTQAARLDLLGAMQQLTADCGNPIGENNIDNIKISNLGNQLVVEYTGNAYKDFKLEMYSVDGILLKSMNVSFQAFQSNQTKIEMGELPAGAYIISLRDGNKLVSKKFIKFK